jgi:hypothetical protein
MPNPDVSALRTPLGQNGHYWYRFKPVMRWDVVRFLLCGAIILLMLGVSGVLNLLPLFPRASLFHPPYWINWVQLSVGGLVLAVTILGSKRLQVTLALVPTIAGTMVGLGGLVIEAYVALRNGTPQSSISRTLSPFSPSACWPFGRCATIGVSMTPAKHFGARHRMAACL